MPPSAGACQTTEAALKPDCGRASAWSSTMTAIGWRAASAGVTIRPVSGAGTRTGAGLGATLGDEGPPGLSDGELKAAAAGPAVGDAAADGGTAGDGVPPCTAGFSGPGPARAAAAMATAATTLVRIRPTVRPRMRSAGYPAGRAAAAVGWWGPGAFGAARARRGESDDRRAHPGIRRDPAEAWPTLRARRGIDRRAGV